MDHTRYCVVKRYGNSMLRSVFCDTTNLKSLIGHLGVEPSTDCSKSLRHRSYVPPQHFRRYKK
nr:MAG TPA: hypothetical protein [Caudoviricetes sp.]